MSMQFWLGVHQPDWLARLDVPTMVSYRRLARLKTLPLARAPWVQDSGGFTELHLHGSYATSPRQYAERTRVHAAEIGQLAWAAVQDWMCEDLVLQKTGLTIGAHQRRSVTSYLDLMELAPDLPWLPVIQGQTLDDYVRHVELYDQAGVELRDFPVVGIGTVCRRQHTMVAVRLIQGLAPLGLRLHGFGLKVTALQRCADLLASADSMAWSADGRYPQGGRCARVRDHDRCANCLPWAVRWHTRLMSNLSQGRLFA